VSEDMGTTVLASLMSIMVVWLLYFWLYGRYRIDVYRQELQFLRDRLFDEAVYGHIDFSHSAYVLLQDTIDMALASSHQIFLSDVTALLLIRSGKSADMASYRSIWAMSIQNLGPEAKERMNTYRDEMHKVMGNQISLSMPLLSLLTLFLANAVPLRQGWFSPIDVGVYIALLQTHHPAN